MARFRWWLISAVLLLVGVISLGSGWNGNAGFSLASPVSGTVVNFCGAAKGWHALIGVLGLVLGILGLIVALISAATTASARR